MIQEKLLYYPTVTRESYIHQGRVTELIESGKLFKDLNMPVFDPAIDRVMICGGPQMLKDLKKIFEERSFKEGTTTTPGDFVVERAFAES